MAQTALMTILTAVGSVGAYYVAARPAVDPNIPPAPPAPAITAATLHDDNVELKKLLGEVSDKLDSLTAPKPKK